MSDTLLIKSYTPQAAANIRDGLSLYLGGDGGGTWLGAYRNQIFQICDELIKNAIKSNYKFLLIWAKTRERLLAADPDLQAEDMNEWLGEVFFSGEDQLIERHLSRLPEREDIQREVRRLLDLENHYLRERADAARGHLPPGRENIADYDDYAAGDPAFESLARIKRMSRELNIYVHYRIERSSDQVLITVANDSPILDEDVKRIHRVRNLFKKYRDQGRQEEFFIDQLDNSGGGHGLGYAIMDSILLEMHLEPEVSLYLISATRTMVLLVLPLSPPEGLTIQESTLRTEETARSGW